MKVKKYCGIIPVPKHKSSIGKGFIRDSHGGIASAAGLRKKR